MTGLTVALAIAILALGASPQDGRWPVDHPVVVSGFRAAIPDWSTGHRGLDVLAHTGTAVRAIAGGRISFAGMVAGKPVVSVTLTGSGTVRTTFEPVVASVTPGQRVRAGDVIGVVAAAGGHCGGGSGCLHVGLRAADRYLDPLRLIIGAPAVLKPLSLLGSSPRMGEGERGPQPLDGHVGVPLGRGHGRVPE